MRTSTFLFVSKNKTYAWEQRKFMECINNVVDYRGKTPKKLGMNWSEEGFLALSALNVKDGYIDFELDANYGDIELYNAWMKQDLSKGQVVFTTEAPMGNVAQIPDESKYILSQRVIAFEVAHEKITDDFLATLLKSPKVFDNLTSLATGGTAKGVSQRSLSKLSVKIPQIIEEQNKIAKIICTLNKAITLHQRKYDALKSMKKTLLSKMFPKNGEDVPEIRFKEFTDAWEQRKLGSDINVTSVKRVHQSDWETEGVPFYRARDIVSEFKGEEISEPIFVSKKTYEEFSRISGKVQADDLLVTGVGTIGVPYLVKSNNPLYFKDGNVIWIQNNKKLDGYFLFYTFITNPIQNFIRESAGTGTVGTLTIETCKRIPVFIPGKREQIAVGEFFQSLDNLITLHQRKLEELKNMKKTLLQQMFV